MPSHRVLCVRLRGDLMATGSADRTVKVWTLSTGECLTTLSGHTVSSYCMYIHVHVHACVVQVFCCVAQTDRHM